MCHCIQGCTHFSFGRIEYSTEDPIGCRKKIECLYKLQTKGEHANGIFHKVIEHLHFLQQRNDRVP